MKGIILSAIILLTGTYAPVNLPKIHVHRFPSEERFEKMQEAIENRLESESHKFERHIFGR